MTDEIFIQIMNALRDRKPHPGLKPPSQDMLYYWQWGYRA